LRVDLFDFKLPDRLIALRPAEPRESARLLTVRPGAKPELDDRTIADLASYPRSNDVLVINDTKVIPARLFGERHRDGSVARIEVLLLRRLGDERWRALARPAKRLAAGDRIVFGEQSEGIACELGRLMATVETKGVDGDVELAFDFHGALLDEAIERFGHVPLPPYIAGRRPDDARDRTDYQTIYAREPGAVAAPTAGLHLTRGLIDAVRASGASIARLTLHVGPGTFLPVKAADTADHRLHGEWGAIDAQAAACINAARDRGGRIFAVGSTSLRLLESAADNDGGIAPFAGETSIFITPGYRFKAVDALLTNFHLPRSTLFMLVCAFAGIKTMRRAYAHAIIRGYRFYSYGDASLLFRRDARETPR
jgi:S-adenosylmethionine:tRNA ribosyltransferase-isomerase